MSFPSIPTVAAGRVLTAVQADTTATRTFPSLSGLTKNAGDRIVAICIAYQTGTGTDAAFSGWTGGFTEVADRATSTTMAVGVAELISTGSETGTFAVTQAATITGHACFILLSIAGAHGSTPVEVSPKTDGTSAAANPASFNPTSWDVEDTLWIAVGGSGEVSTTGSYTGITTAPTNFTDAAATAASGDVAGAVQGAVAFRQNAVASEDVGTWTVDLSNARNSAVVIAVRPLPAAQSVTAQIATLTLSGIAGTATPGNVTQTAQVGTVTLAGIAGSPSNSGAGQAVVVGLARPMERDVADDH